VTAHGTVALSVGGLRRPRRRTERRTRSPLTPHIAGDRCFLLDPRHHPGMARESPPRTFRRLEAPHPGPNANQRPRKAADLHVRGADDGIRTRDPHLGNVLVSVHSVTAHTFTCRSVRTNVHRVVFRPCSSGALYYGARSPRGTARVCHEARRYTRLRTRTAGLTRTAASPVAIDQIPTRSASTGLPTQARPDTPIWAGSDRAAVPSMRSCGTAGPQRHPRASRLVSRASSPPDDPGARSRTSSTTPRRTSPMAPATT